MARICETVTASTMTELRRARDRATSADLVELRLDGVADVDRGGRARRPHEARHRDLPARPGKAGRSAGARQERLRILGEAIRLGAEFVDVEWRADHAALPGFGRTRLIAVAPRLHRAAGTIWPARIRSMRAAAGSGVIKIAVATPTLGGLPAPCATRSGEGGEQVVIGMGAAGIVTRVCPWLYGSQWTYGGTGRAGADVGGRLD